MGAVNRTVICSSNPRGHRHMHVAAVITGQYLDDCMKEVEPTVLYSCESSESPHDLDYHESSGEARECARELVLNGETLKDQ